MTRPIWRIGAATEGVLERQCFINETPYTATTVASEKKLYTGRKLNHAEVMKRGGVF
jgi:hypothetical protein